MIACLRDGLRLIQRLPRITVLFAIYQIAWAITLFTVLRAVVEPLLYRLPHTNFASVEMQVLAAEAQFRLIKTNIAWPALALVGGLLAIRMMFTPFMNAALYHAIHAGEEQNRPLRLLWEGSCRLGGRFLLFQLVQWVLLLAPLVFAYYQAGGLPSLLTADVITPRLALFLLLYTGYVASLRLTFIYLLFTCATVRNWKEGIALVLTRLVRIVLISLAVFIVYAIIYSAFGMLSFVYAGFAGLIAYVTTYGLRALFKLWEIAAHYHCYRSAMKM